MNKNFKDINFDEILSKVSKKTNVNDIKDKKVKRNKKDLSNLYVDIMTFCHDENYLNFSGTKPQTHLTISQRIILKTFYSGSVGNENLCLTDEEINWLEDFRDNKADDEMQKKTIDLCIEKTNEGTPINELVLVIGRRSGKTFLTSIMATYEAYKCLELKNPQEFFNISPDSEIYLLNVATASPQAEKLFSEIKSKIRNAPYFRGKLNQRASNNETLYLLTETDKHKNQELEDQSRLRETTKGSIVILCGHSNSNSLMGSGVIFLAFDELAYFLDNTGRKSGSKVYNDLSPNCRTFFYPDESPAYRIVSISAPEDKSGVFYNNFVTSLKPEGKNMLSYQFPTWEVSPNIKSKDQLASEYAKDPIEADKRYGAKFSGSSTQKFFPPDEVDKCVDFNLYNKEKGKPYIRYYAHVDPALNNHNYAFIILHNEKVFNKDSREFESLIVVDHMKKWEPSIDKEVNFEEVDNYIISICKKFNIVSLTYDSWNSAHSIQKMRKKGLPVKRTPFRSRYKQLIFGELRNYVISNTLRIPGDETLIGELKSLKCKIVSNGFKVYPDSDADIKTDDYCDCLAGAAHQTFESNQNELPKGRIVDLGKMSKNRVGSLYSTNPSIQYGK